MIIKVVTDCTGNKQDVIKDVFSKKFKDCTIEIVLKKGEGFQTPLTQEDFSLVVQKRLQWIQKNVDNPTELIIATIQKGYYYSCGLWHLSACVGIAHPVFKTVVAMASSVPIDRDCSEKKSRDLSKNMSDILKEEFPEWDKQNGSAYNLLTEGGDEHQWLAQPLKHCIRCV